MNYLTFKELRARLGNRARSTIYLDIEDGRLPKPIKLGGKLYWSETDIELSIGMLRDAPPSKRVTMPKKES
jgi:prophage regulatory protein